MPFLEQQLQWIYFLQQARGPFVDSIFRLLNLFDTEAYFCCLIAMIWIGFSWRWGCRLGYLIILSGWVNGIVKIAAALPRPFFFDADLAIVQTHSYGFPSGGAQNAMLLGSLLIYFWKSRWAWPVGLFYILLISFSRVFLGVHFLMDVLGGWVIGSALFVAFVRCHSLIERQARRHSAGFLIAIVAVSFLVGWAIADNQVIFLMSAIASMTMGIYVSTKYNLYMTSPKGLIQKLSLGLFAILTAFGWIWLVWRIPLNPIASIIVSSSIASLWISWFISPVCRRLFLF
jgi:membrane-associated phospholipid phosphatase